MLTITFYWISYIIFASYSHSRLIGNRLVSSHRTKNRNQIEAAGNWLTIYCLLCFSV